MNVPGNFYCLLIRGSHLNTEEKRQIGEIYASYGRESLYELVRKKKILPFAANTFRRCGLEPDFWMDILEKYRARNGAILKFLDKAYQALREQGVRKMFVSENFGALLSANEDIGLFASGDVDNYADPSEKERIYRAFEAIGCTRKERFSGAHQIAAEFFPNSEEALPKGFYVSVDFYPLARLKLPCFIKADDFVDWSKTSTYKGSNIVLPPPEALTYICMLHISLHSFSRAPDIRLYIDLLNMFHTGADYEKIAGWCRRDQTCTRAAAAVELSNYLMNTNFPATIVQLSKRKEKLEKMVYSSEKNDLIYEPRGVKVLLIELMCDDSGVLHGLREILFPDEEWMRSVYGSSGVTAHLKHMVKVL